MAPVCILRIRLMVDDWTGEYPIWQDQWKLTQQQMIVLN